jgi:aryl-alcohol dehydrogenase-like predicted oxidoreductase
MKYRKLGGSDIAVSVLGLGGNTFGPPRIDATTTKDVIRHALDYGVNFIDTAIGYGGGESERYIGSAVKGRRDKVVIATKFNLHGDPSDPAERIRRQCDESLGKLQTDYIDLLQIHTPTDLLRTDELLGILSRLVQDGKVRAIGASNYSSWRLAESKVIARALGLPSFVSVQNQYSLLYRRAEQELVQACDRYGVSLIPFHPLAGGVLTGKYHRDRPAPAGTRGAAGSPIVKRMSTEQNWQVLDALSAFAAERSHNLGELAVAWLAAKPHVGSVITGVSTVQQLQQNIAGAGWSLTPEEISAVDTISDTGQDAPAEDYAAQAGRSSQ